MFFFESLCKRRYRVETPVSVVIKSRYMLFQAHAADGIGNAGVLALPRSLQPVFFDFAVEGAFADF